MWFGSEFLPRACYRCRLLFCHTCPFLPLRLVYLIVSAARCLQAVGCVLFTCCGLEWEHCGSQLYRSVPRVLATRKCHENISYFRIGKMWTWHLRQTCCVSLILGLSRLLESCLYFLKCYTCSYWPLFSFWKCTERLFVHFQCWEHLSADDCLFLKTTSRSSILSF